MKRADMKVGQILALVRNPKGDLYDRKPRKVVLVDLVAPGRYIGAGPANNKVLVRHVDRAEDVKATLANLFPDFDKCLAEWEALVKADAEAWAEQERREQTKKARMRLLMQRFAKLFEGGARAAHSDREVVVTVDAWEKILDRLEGGVS